MADKDSTQDALMRAEALLSLAEAQKTLGAVKSVATCALSDVKIALAMSGDAASSAVPAGWKLIKEATYEERSYPEDVQLENGCYFCTCHNCERQFTGHKRRAICKACAAPDLKEAI